MWQWYTIRGIYLRSIWLRTYSFEIEHVNPEERRERADFLCGWGSDHCQPCRLSTTNDGLCWQDERPNFMNRSCDRPVRMKHVSKNVSYIPVWYIHTSYLYSYLDACKDATVYCYTIPELQYLHVYMLVLGIQQVHACCVLFNHNTYRCEYIPGTWYMCTADCCYFVLLLHFYTVAELTDPLRR